MSRHRDAWTQAINAKELAAKRQKYGNKKVVVDSMEFDSKREAARWLELKLMQQAGQITDLRRQEAFDLIAWTHVAAWGSGATITGESVGVYVSDFTYLRDGQKVIEDTKSPATRRIPLYRLKAKIVEANYGISITEV